MKVWKLVAGILSIILFIIVEFQSCAVGATNVLAENGGISGSVGMLVGILLLAGGIVSIAVRNAGNGGDIALIVIFGFAALIGYAGHGNYSDLVFWAFWALINLILAVTSLILRRIG